MCTQCGMYCIKIMKVSKLTVLHQWVVSPQQKQCHNIWLSFLTKKKKKKWSIFMSTDSLLTQHVFFSFTSAWFIPSASYLSPRFERLRASNVLPLNKLSSFNSHSREILSVLRKRHKKCCEILLDVSAVFIFWLGTFMSLKAVKLQARTMLQCENL